MFDFVIVTDFLSVISGTLSLVSLDFVNIRSVEMIKAVGKMCPALKEILFCELMHANAADVQELSDILKTQWPKVLLNAYYVVCILLKFICYWCVNILTN